MTKGGLLERHDEQGINLANLEEKLEETIRVKLETGK